MEWISVKERLPDEPGLYICLTHCDLDDSYDVVILSFVSLPGMRCGEPRWMDCDALLSDFWTRDDVIYWMPLPELPEDIH